MASGSASFRWILVGKSGSRAAGAVGFVGNTASAIVAFHDEYRNSALLPAVRWPPTFLAKFGRYSGAALTVAKIASNQSDVEAGDPSVPRGDYGIYAGYFAPRENVRKLTSAFDRGLARIPGTGSNRVKHLILRTGQERAVLAACDGSV